MGASDYKANHMQAQDILYVMLVIIFMRSWKPTL